MLQPEGRRILKDVRQEACIMSRVSIVMTAPMLAHRSESELHHHAQTLTDLCCLAGQRGPAEPAADGGEEPARARGAPESAAEGAQQSARPGEDAASQRCPPASAAGELPGALSPSSHRRRCIRSVCESTGHTSLLLEMTLRPTAAHLCQQPKSCLGLNTF